MRVLIAAAFVLVLVGGCGGEKEARPLLAAAERTAITNITQNPEVLDATISQAGSTLSLALVVSAGTGTARSRELGESFVRLVKNFGPDMNPQAELGKGDYTYIITIALPDQTTFLRGEKKASAPTIEWDT